MAEWLVTLQGDRFDLDLLSRLLQSPACSVSKEGDTYYLRSQEFSTLEDAGDVKRCADELLPTLKGAAAALHGDLENVSIHRISRVEDSGGPPTQFIFPGPVVFRGRARVIANLTNATGPTDATGPSDLERWRAVATKDLAVKKALWFFGCVPHSSGDVWKVWETIKCDMGGGKSREQKKQGLKEVVDRAWATEPEIEVFEHTVNCPTALGDAARHAESECNNREHISWREVESFIRRVLRAWVGAKVASLPPGSRADGAP